MLFGPSTTRILNFYCISILKCFVTATEVQTKLLSVEIWPSFALGSKYFLFCFIPFQYI